MIEWEKTEWVTGVSKITQTGLFELIFLGIVLQLQLIALLSLYWSCWIWFSWIWSSWIWSSWTRNDCSRTFLDLFSFSIIRMRSAKEEKHRKPQIPRLLTDAHPENCLVFKNCLKEQKTFNFSFSMNFKVWYFADQNVWKFDPKSQIFVLNY